MCHNTQSYEHYANYINNNEVISHNDNITTGRGEYLVFHVNYGSARGNYIVSYQTLLCVLMLLHPAEIKRHSPFGPRTVLPPNECLRTLSQLCRA